MLDNLIMAYRAQIYDWSLSRWTGFFKNNKLLTIGLGVFVLLLGISVVACLKFQSSLFMLIVLISECVIAVFGDRYVVKQYQKYILGKQLHLDKTVVFLKTVLPEKNLFSAVLIEELTERLTQLIELGLLLKASLRVLPILQKQLFYQPLHTLRVFTLESWNNLILSMSLVGQ